MPLEAQLVKNPPAMQETLVWFLVWEILWRKYRLPTPVLLFGECHGQRRLTGYSPLGLKESYLTEQPLLSLVCLYICAHSVITLHYDHIYGNVGARATWTHLSQERLTLQFVCTHFYALYYKWHYDAYKEV